MWEFKIKNIIVHRNRMCIIFTVSFVEMLFMHVQHDSFPNSLNKISFLFLFMPFLHSPNCEVRLPSQRCYWFDFRIQMAIPFFSSVSIRKSSFLLQLFCLSHHCDNPMPSFVFFFRFSLRASLLTARVFVHQIDLEYNRDAKRCCSRNAFLKFLNIIGLFVKVFAISNYVYKDH